MSEKLSQTPENYKRETSSAIPPRAEINSYIDVDSFVSRFGVKNESVRETLYEFPTLSYLLGNVTHGTKASDSRPDGVFRNVYFLTEGSGMYGLKKPEDAARWKGIFNHVMGTARHVTYLTDELSEMSENQLQKWQELGFDAHSFKGLNTAVLRDFFFISHAGRRQMDEKVWHSPQDKAHPIAPADSGLLTTMLLKKQKAHPFLIDLMRVENHADHLAEAGENGFMTNALDNILTYCDWTYGQRPTPLKDRFEGLKNSGRQKVEVLNVLERSGTTFENGLKKTLGDDIYDRMTTKAPYDWEYKIREGYCASSGISPAETFPETFTR